MSGTSLVTRVWPVGEDVTGRCAIGTDRACRPVERRPQLRVARRLAELPTARVSFGRGELSYSQVRALARIATTDTEGDLVELARHATAAQLEVIVRAYRGVLEAGLGGSDPKHRRRWLRCEHDDDGALLLSARLPAEEGALVLAALEAGRDELRAPGPASAETTQDGDTAGQGERASIANADALVLMANTLLSSGAAERSGGDSHQVVVHVDATALAEGGAGQAGGEGTCHLEHGAPLHQEPARRLACDASIVRILERDGRPLSIGRKTRSVPPAVRRALRSRDRSCRFPGCGQRRFLHAHHVEHWLMAGGPTCPT
jgi:hypothetical protein